MQPTLLLQHLDTRDGQIVVLDGVHAEAQAVVIVEGVEHWAENAGLETIDDGALDRDPWWESHDQLRYRFQLVNEIVVRTRLVVIEYDAHREAEIGGESSQFGQLLLAPLTARRRRCHKPHPEGRQGCL